MKTLSDSGPKTFEESNVQASPLPKRYLTTMKLTIEHGRPMPELSNMFVGASFRVDDVGDLTILEYSVCDNGLPNGQT